MEDKQTTETVDTTEENKGDTSTANEGSSKVFTEDQVTKIVTKRVKNLENKLKEAESLTSVVEELRNELKLMKDAQKQIETKYTETVFNSILESTAKELNLDVTLATKLLDREKIIVVEEKPSNIKELLQALIETHPQLVRKAGVTPTVIVTTETEKQFSLHKTPNTNNFFKGGGLRLNTVKESN